MRIVPFVNNIIIAPHGITDLIHAHHNDLIKPLLQIYGATFTASQILHITHLDIATHILFAVASIAHFRHDLSQLYMYRKTIDPVYLSTLFVLLTPLLGTEAFTCYMVLIHVPRHYIKSMSFLKEYVKEFHILLAIVSVISFYIYEKIGYMNVLPSLEALVISHVLYNEKFVDNIESQDAH